MNSESTFLEAIRAAPDEDAPRLAYANWLAEQPEPAEREWGEFIRVQCSLAKLAEDDPTRAPLAEREAELLRQHENSWTDGAFLGWLAHPKKGCRTPMGHGFCQLMAQGLAAHLERERLPPGAKGRGQLQKVIDECGRKMDREFNYNAATCTSGLFDDVTFRRGFIEEATVQDFFVHLFAEAVFSLTVVRELTIDEEWISELGDAVLRGLLRGLKRPQLRSLDVATVMDSVTVIEEFAACPHLTSLTDLDLFLPEEGDEAVRALARSRHLRDLRQLSLSCQAPFTDDALRALLESPHLTGLTELSLDCEKPAFSAEMRTRYEARFGKEP